MEAAHHLSPGTRLNNGSYVIDKALGEGGFGIVYSAYNRNGQKVAIKEFFRTDLCARTTGNNTVSPKSTMPEDIYAYGESLKRFSDEYKRMKKFVGDPNIVTVLDHFEENNTAYIVMEFIEGTTFLQYLGKSGRLTLKDALKILEPMVGALERIHAKNYIHRDFSPDNVMLARDGSVKLLDFGAARESTMTRPSVVLKKGYAPFEQYIGNTKVKKVIDGKEFDLGEQKDWTDVYAFAATLYFAVTKIHPIDATLRSAGHELELPSKINKSITSEQETVLLKGLAIYWPDRYETMREFYEALKDTIENEPPPPVEDPNDTETVSIAHLPIGYRLTDVSRAEDHIISGVLDRGDVCITYLTWSEKTQSNFVVKEFFPSVLARRARDQMVFTVTPEEEAAHPSWDDDAAIPAEGAARTFREGLAQFLEDAQQLMKFNQEPNVVGIKSVFRANGTAYMVMEFIEGCETLEQRLQSRGRMSLTEVLTVLEPIVKVLERMYTSTKFTHRGINPKNIVFTHDGTIKLMDSVSAISPMINSFENQYRAAVLRNEYSPPEIESHNASVDVYSLAAVIYRAITGEAPPHSMIRTMPNKDTLVLPSRFGIDITTQQEAALLKGLALEPNRRYQTVRELFEALTKKMPSGKKIGLSMLLCSCGVLLSFFLVYDMLDSIYWMITETDWSLYTRIDYLIYVSPTFRWIAILLMLCSLIYLYELWRLHRRCRPGLLNTRQRRDIIFVTQCILMLAFLLTTLAKMTSVEPKIILTDLTAGMTYACFTLGGMWLGRAAFDDADHERR